MNKYNALVEIVRMLHRKSPVAALAAILIIFSAPTAFTVAMGVAIKMLAAD